MITRTFLTPDGKYRLIVTRNGHWTLELRQSNGVSIGKMGDDYDQIAGELFITGCQRSGNTPYMAALFAQADEAIDNGYFAEVLAK